MIQSILCSCRRDIQNFRKLVILNFQGSKTKFPISSSIFFLHWSKLVGWLDGLFIVTCVIFIMTLEVGIFSSILQIGKLRFTHIAKYPLKSLSLLQWIFLTQELNWGLLLCRWILYQLRYQGNPKNTGVGCHFLLQGIFPTQGSTHISCISCIGRQVLYH